MSSITYACAEDRNKKHRRKMEDAMVAIPDLADPDSSTPGPGAVALFAVYDGHSGRGAADFCAEHLHKVLLELCPSVHDAPVDDVSRALEQTFLETNNRLAGTPSVPKHAGCTAVVCLVRTGPAGGKEVFVANAGDARAVLRRHNGAVERLSEDHKASVAAEADRVTAAGGFISKDRVNGQIEITRSIGDQLLKKYVVADPFVSTTTVDGSGLLIVACDGVWDVFTDEQAAEFTATALEKAGTSDDDVAATLPEASKALVADALARGCTDNLSAIIVKF